MTNEFRYHPEIEGLKVNEHGSEVFFKEKEIQIKVKKSGNHPFRYIQFDGIFLGVARLVLESWKGMADNRKLTAQHIDGDYTNYFYENLQWSSNGGNSKYPPKINPEQKKEILQKIADGKGDSEIAKDYGVTRNAIFNLRKKQEK